MPRGGEGRRFLPPYSALPHPHPLAADIDQLEKKTIGRVLNARLCTVLAELRLIVVYEDDESIKRIM